MINWERRKQSENWAREKSVEFYKANSDLTFAEWCYRQGKAEERENIINIIENCCWRDVEMLVDLIKE